VEIKLTDISKRYIYDWILSGVNHTFRSGSITGVTGINGSGKSTLIKIISGYLSPSEGSITYALNGKQITRSDIHKYVSIVAPYTELILEYELEEMYNFHTKFRKLSDVASYTQFRDLVRLKGHAGKALMYYSSGMKQRVQLALALLTPTKILLLDEPTSYLDQENKKWFYDLLAKRMPDRTVIISSNDTEDFQYCSEVLDLSSNNNK